MNATEKIEKEIEKWKERLKQLDSQAAAAGRELAELERQREAFVLAAGLGDARAQQQLDALEARAAKAMRRERDLRSALEQARAKLSEAETGFVAAQRGEKTAVIGQQASEVVSLAGRVDAATETLVDLLFQFEQTARDLHGTIQALDGDLQVLPPVRRLLYTFLRGKLRRFFGSEWDSRIAWTEAGTLGDVLARYLNSSPGTRLGFSVEVRKDDKAA